MNWIKRPCLSLERWRFVSHLQSLFFQLRVWGFCYLHVRDIGGINLNIFSNWKCSEAMLFQAEHIVPYLNFSVEFSEPLEKLFCLFFFLANWSFCNSYIISVNRELLLIVLAYVASDQGKINGWVIVHDIFFRIVDTSYWNSGYPTSWIFFTLCKHWVKVLLKSLTPKFRIKSNENIFACDLYSLLLEL